MTDPVLKGLYAITDPHLIAPDELIAKVDLAIQGGARLIQYRHKPQDRAMRQRQARDLAMLCRSRDTALIVNDDVDLARECGAQGVHLGKEDTDIATARALLGPGAVIGVSCYDQLDHAIDAEYQGADYVAFGSLYSSPTKPDATTASLELIREARRRLTLPICVIGGITPANAPHAIQAGADMLAVISAVFGAPDPRSAARAFAILFS